MEIVGLCFAIFDRLSFVTKKTGLVSQFHVWMRKLDQALAHDGIFVGSYTRRYLVHPEMGEIPQIECEVIDLGFV